MPSKAKTIKPEKWWMEWHPHYGFMAKVGMTRKGMQDGMDPGSTPVRVEIRDAATAKLRDAVVEAAFAWAHGTPGDKTTGALMKAIHEAKAVRRG